MKQDEAVPFARRLAVLHSLNLSSWMAIGMRTFSCSLAALALLGIALGPISSAGAETPEELLGEWELTGSSQNGRSASDQEVKEMGTRCVFNKTDCTFEVRQNASKRTLVTFKVTIDHTQSPFQIDLIPEAKEERSLRCIYKVEKNILTIASDDSGKVRPKNFDGAPATGPTIMVLRRVSH